MNGSAAVTLVMSWDETRAELEKYEPEKRFMECARLLDILTDGMRWLTSHVVEIPTGFNPHDFEYYGEIRSNRDLLREFVIVTILILDMMDECSLQ